MSKMSSTSVPQLLRYPLTLASSLLTKSVCCLTILDISSFAVQVLKSLSTLLRIRQQKMGPSFWSSIKMSTARLAASMQTLLLQITLGSRVGLVLPTCLARLLRSRFSQKMLERFSSSSKLVFDSLEVESVLQDSLALSVSTSDFVGVIKEFLRYSSLFWASVWGLQLTDLNNWGLTGDSEKCLNRSFQSTLQNQSFCSIFASKVMVFEVTASVLSGNLRWLLFMQRMSPAMDLDSKGQKPKSISQRITPSDHISALRVQAWPLNTSGAMQTGDPTMVVATGLSFISAFENPKSPNLILLLWKKMFSGLRSRWITLCLFSSWKATTICRMISRTSYSVGGFVFLRNSARVPPLQYSQTMQKLVWLLKDLTCWITWLLFLTRWRDWISFWRYCSRVGLRVNRSLGITLMATVWLSKMLKARQTFPKAPSPMESCMRQLSTSFPMAYFNIHTGNQANLNNPLLVQNYLF